ncbi:MAG: S-adenosylmethionine:tRNA ribosyltransferase-isomerase [Chlorobi bacterium]|nr:S-adenosylmethionine:tRNA ribosyltransferase-isomerase [Chlorobiota bacterium]
MTDSIIPHIETALYDYELPPERIAQQPLPQRDESRLLIADQRNGTIQHYRFYELPSLLPDGAYLVRNTTRVIPARIFARKASGGSVEVLLVEPADGSPPEQTLGHAKSQWICLIRGRNIRPNTELVAEWMNSGIRVRILDRDGMFARVAIECFPETTTLAEQLAHAGRMPLPPYIRRTPSSDDSERYQTIYARTAGSVAAPTAGLHFTERVLTELERRGIDILDVVLHVGPGTFQPLRADDAWQHTMHAERIRVERDTIATLATLTATPNRSCFCIGTTSVRTIETLYWLGVKVHSNRQADPTILRQHEPYCATPPPQVDAPTALKSLVGWLDDRRQKTLEASTQLYIVPGYRYRIADGMITNFHQPRSTLLLLVAAFVGDWWRTIYDEALARGYRFLSYGDASLLIGAHDSRS